MPIQKLNLDLVKANDVAENVEAAAELALGHITSSDRSDKGIVSLNVSNDYYPAALSAQGLEKAELKNIADKLNIILQGESLAVANTASGIFKEDSEVTRVVMKTRTDLTENSMIVDREKTGRNPQTGEETVTPGALSTKCSVRVSKSALNKIKSFSKEATRSALAD